MIGYARANGSYRVLLMDGSITEATSVVFDEHTMDIRKIVQEKHISDDTKIDFNDEINSDEDLTDQVDTTNNNPITEIENDVQDEVVDNDITPKVI